MKVSLLRDGELLRDGASSEEVEALLSPEDEFSAPWIAKLLLGLGGWLTALFVTGFTGLLLFDTFRQNEQNLAVGIGLVYLVGSVLLSRTSNHPFLSQLTLASGTAGLALVVVGLWEGSGVRDGFYSLWGLIVLCPIIYLLSKNDIQRFSAVFAVFLVWLIHDGEYRSDERFAIPLLVALLCTLVLICGALKTSYWRPALFGTVFGLFQILYASLVAHGASDPPWVSGVIAVGFLAVLWWLIKPRDSGSYLLLGLLGVVLFVSAFFGAGGIAVCLGLLLVGHARNDRALSWVAILGLTVFVIAFYYFLGVPLLIKSYTMMGTGILFLIVPFLAKVLFNQNKTTSL